MVIWLQGIAVSHQAIRTQLLRTSFSSILCPRYNMIKGSLKGLFNH